MNEESRKKKIAYVIGGVLLLIIIVIGFTFAYWQIIREGEENFFTTGCFDITLSEENPIEEGDVQPESDEDGMRLPPYTFTVKNVCDITAVFHVNLEVLTGDFGAGVTQLNAQYVRVALDGGPAATLSGLKTATKTLENATASYELATGTLGENESANYEFRMWMNNTTPPTEGSNKYFSTKIVVIADAMKTHVALKLPENPIGQYDTSGTNNVNWNSSIAALEIGAGAFNKKTFSYELKNTTPTLTQTDASGNQIYFADYIISLADGKEDSPADTANTVSGVYKVSYDVDKAAEITKNGVSYYYEGSDVNNYVSFNGEMWRIIGVFDETAHGISNTNLVKLVKDYSITGIVWNKSGGASDWSTSTLFKLLNTDYYNGATTTATNDYCYGYSGSVTGNCDFTKMGIRTNYYRSMIQDVYWTYGRVSGTGQFPDVFYVDERQTKLTEAKPIGLISGSDYAYSVTTNCNRTTTKLSNYNTSICGGASWLRGVGPHTWTITGDSSNNNNAFYVNHLGYLGSTNANYGHAVRPSLYLKSAVKVIAGN